MRKWLARFWRDERGAVAAGEWVFVATILALGAVTGAVVARHLALAEPADAPAALGR
jgi:Flp pilus assembly pilin Flp